MWRKSQSSTDNDCPFPEPTDDAAAASGAVDGGAEGTGTGANNPEDKKEESTDDLEFHCDDDGDDFLASARARLRAKQRSNSVDASAVGGKGHHGALRSGLAR